MISVNTPSKDIRAVPLFRRLFLGLALATATAAWAQETVTFRAYGPFNGDEPSACATWTRSAATTRALEWWTMGLLTGASRELALGGQKVAETDPAAIRRWMRSWCAQHPRESVLTAALALVDDLKAKQPRGR